LLLKLFVFILGLFYCQSVLGLGLRFVELLLRLIFGLGFGFVKSS
jgi:hypothetical protein